MAKPLISIITPSYNQGEYLEDAIKSVMQETSCTIEHIVVDGGSDDQTIPILKEYESEYNMHWISESDNGQSEAINKGINMAQGQFVGWLNADDYYFPGTFDTVKDSINSNTDADVVYGDLMYVDSEGSEIRPKYHSSPSKFVQKHWRHYTANHCTFIKRSSIIEIGGVCEDLEYVMDADLFWRILNGDYKQQHEAVFFGAHRLHEEAKTGGEKSHRQIYEEKHLRDLYSTSPFENRLPRPILKHLAIILQLILFTREQNWKGLNGFFNERLR